MKEKSTPPTYAAKKGKAEAGKLMNPAEAREAGPATPPKAVPIGLPIAPEEYRLLKERAKKSP
jgi:hypothetical protein